MQDFKWKREPNNGQTLGQDLEENGQKEKS